MYELISVRRESDIPKEHSGTPVGQLLRYQNLAAPFPECGKAEMLIAMCMDNRKQLKLPENFAYIIRTGGGNLRFSEFKLSYAIALGGIRHVALIAHNHCGMVDLMSRKEEFISGLCQLPNWDAEQAEEHFLRYAPVFEIGNELDFVVDEAKRLGGVYQGVSFVPLFYNIDDNMLSLIADGMTANDNR